MEGPLSERHTMGGWLCGEGQCRDGDTGMEGTLATLPDTICSFSGIAEGRECRQDRGNRTPFLSLPWEGSFREWSHTAEGQAPVRRAPGAGAGHQAPCLGALQPRGRSAEGAGESPLASQCASSHWLCCSCPGP